MVLRSPLPSCSFCLGHLRLVAAAAATAASVLACDNDAATKAADAGASASASVAPPPASTASAAPAATTKPQLAVDDTAAFISGERFDLAAPDPRGRFLAALGERPIAGETLVLNAARETKLPKVTVIVSSLVAKKAKAVDIHTPRRDRSAAEVAFVTDTKPADCSAVAFIAKEGAISVWPASGATAERFARGMAGPDLTRGSEGVKKRLLACDAPVWFVGADESVTWGLVYDLVLAVTGNEDGGVPLTKPRSVALLTKTPVPGRKIEVETAN